MAQAGGIEDWYRGLPKVTRGYMTHAAFGDPSAAVREAQREQERTRDVGTAADQGSKNGMRADVLPPPPPLAYDLRAMRQHGSHTR